MTAHYTSESSAWRDDTRRRFADEVKKKGPLLAPMNRY